MPQRPLPPHTVSMDAMRAILNQKQELEALRKFVKDIASMTKSGECYDCCRPGFSNPDCLDHQPREQSPEDAQEEFYDLIDEARKLSKFNLP